MKVNDILNKVYDVFPFVFTNDNGIAIGRGAHNLKEAVKIAKGLGLNHREAWDVWTRVLKNKKDAIVRF